MIAADSPCLVRPRAGVYADEAIFRHDDFGQIKSSIVKCGVIAAASLCLLRRVGEGDGVGEQSV